MCTQAVASFKRLRGRQQDPGFHELTPQIRYFRTRIARMCMLERIPWNRINDESSTLRHEIEDGHQMSLGSNLQQYVPDVNLLEMNDIMTETTDRRFSVFYDGASRQGPVEIVIIRFVLGKKIQHRALTLTWHDAHLDARRLADNFFAALRTASLIPSFAVASHSDRADVNCAAMELVRFALAENRVIVFCWSHQGVNAGKHLEDSNPPTKVFLNTFRTMLNSAS